MAPTTVIVLQDSAVSIAIKMLMNVTKLIFAFTETASTTKVLIPVSVMPATRDQTAQWMSENATRQTPVSSELVLKLLGPIVVCVTQGFQAQIALST